MSNDAFTDADLRKAMFVPCASKEDLHDWILFYLDLDLPDCIVDEESTATPMDVIWEIYDAALKNVRVDISRLLAYSARDAFKTVLAAILEVLCVVHLERNVAHMAAIEPQAMKCQRYVKDYFRRPYLKDYLVTKNVRRIEFAHYVDVKTGTHLTENQYAALLPQAQADYKLKENYIQIVIATMQGANSEHVSLMVIDEVDVIENPKAYEEAKFIASPWMGKMPITLLISTRKTSFGLVQQEINKSPKTKLLMRHWNIIDVTEPCPPSRHKPDEPRVTLYRSDEELNHLAPDAFELLDEKAKEKYVKHENAFAGCASCPLFSSCKTRLATNQTSRSGLLKPINHVINMFREVSLESAQAQLMSRKAATTGLIYPRYDGDIHLITATQMAQKIVGMDNAPAYIEKAGLIELMMQQGLSFYAGLDWGFDHLYVLVSGAICGLDFFIFDVIAQSGLDPEQKLEVSQKVKLWNPVIFADPEAADQIALFKKKHFLMREWKKGPGSIKMGIDVVRMKLRPATTSPQLYFLRGDPQCEMAADHIAKHHFTMDATGEPTDIPSEDKKDIPDAVRYVVLNLFTPKGRVTVSEERASGTTIASPPKVVEGPTQENYLNYFINQHLGQPAAGDSDPSAKSGKKGRIIWSLD